VVEPARDPSPAVGMTAIASKKCDEGARRGGSGVAPVCLGWKHSAVA
jgi:hypothetical protein